MIHFSGCSEVDMKLIYEGFIQGFADYVVPMTLTQEQFEKHFFGGEGNQLEYSIMALDDEIPIGVILGGIREFDGLKTLRCGALCVKNEYRRQGISRKLYELHHKAAMENYCKQLYLEVLCNNEGAIALYEKLGYRKSTIMRYYTVTRDEFLQQIKTRKSSIEESSNRNLSEKEITYAFRELEQSIVLQHQKEEIEYHVNWQIDRPTYDYGDMKYIGLYRTEKLVGILVIDTMGKILFLWVEKAYRNQGLGTKLIKEGFQVTKANKMSITTTSNGVLEGFVRRLGFHKEELEQYEMYLPLSE